MSFLSKFLKQVQSIQQFRSKATKQQGQSYRTGKGEGVIMSVFGQDGFKPSMSLAKTLRKHTKNLIKEAIKVEQTRDINLIKTPNTTAHRYMYQRGYVDEYGVLLKSKQKTLMAWTSTKNKTDMDKAYFNISESTFTNERDYAKYLIIRSSQVGVDIELASRFANMQNTIFRNFEVDQAELLNDTMTYVVNNLNTNERRWFLAMLDTGQNGFSIRIIYEIANTIGKTDEQLSTELLDRFNIAIERTKEIANKRFKFADLIENTKHNND